MAKKKERSEYWTPKGNKRYLKRDKKGKIVDNQSYKKSHGEDIKRRAVSEK